MYAAVTLLVFMCLTATTRADHHHHPCHSPNMTGFMSVITIKGDVKAYGAFTYDSMGKKLRFRSNESNPTNTSLAVDLLMFFDEGIFYEIDSKNQSCEKKKLQCTLHPLDIPDDAKFMSTLNFGNPSIEGEGVKLNSWTGSMPGTKGKYVIYVTTGCLPVSTFYFTESMSFFIGTTEIENEIKDPELLLVPSFCQGLPVEDTPEGTVNSFFHEFM
ncbi:ependymin [Stegastes partitus]|uniref:Ependymin-1-like n=1 Tax=Stegastes partitus TaxID=144197 RepID=A0A3B4YU61_9TELE|nr:PREDICTED: ependymin-1-like [Stegastes partitus]